MSCSREVLFRPIQIDEPSEVNRLGIQNSKFHPHSMEREFNVIAVRVLTYRPLVRLPAPRQERQLG
jgi:hypothetical protein